MADTGENYSLTDFVRKHGFLNLSWPHDITRINVTNNYVTVYYNEMIFASFPIITQHINGIATYVIHGKYRGHKSSRVYSGIPKHVSVKDSIFKTKCIFHLGKKHCINGPAAKNWYLDGTISAIGYYIDGKLHNEKSWACRMFHHNGQLEKEEWCLNGKLHREDGPSIQVWDKKGNLISQEWYCNGIEQDSITTKRAL